MNRRKAFMRFHKAHPEVYRYLKRQALRVRRMGYLRYGIKALYERARWHFTIEKDDAEFKLNNNYHAYYARRLMARVPELEGFFETRKRVV